MQVHVHNQLTVRHDLEVCCNSWKTEELCNYVIDKAQENLHTILKPNVAQILQKLDDKMGNDRIVISSGHAQYFKYFDKPDKKEHEWKGSFHMPVFVKLVF